MSDLGLAPEDQSILCVPWYSDSCASVAVAGLHPAHCCDSVDNCTKDTPGVSKMSTFCCQIVTVWDVSSVWLAWPQLPAMS